MQIGILQTGHAPEGLRPEHGDYPAMFARLLADEGFAFRAFDVEAGEMPDSPAMADGWLITGSRHGVYESHAFIPPLEAFIRDTAAAEAPLVGICFGHQIIAQALGGRVEKFSGGWVVGRQDYVIDGEAMVLNAWHQDQVITLPPCAEVVGESPSCTYAALAYGPRIFTVQPHPEFGAGFVAGLLDTRAPGVVPDPLIAAARKGLSAPTDPTAIAARIGRVLKKEV